jgi:hypothetical protein
LRARPVLGEFFGRLGPFFDGRAIARNWSHEQAALPTTRRVRRPKSRAASAITKLKTSARCAQSECDAGRKRILTQPTKPGRRFTR